MIKVYDLKKIKDRLKVSLKHSKHLFGVLPKSDDFTLFCISYIFIQMSKWNI